MKTLLALLLSASTCLAAPGIPYFVKPASTQSVPIYQQLGTENMWVYTSMPTNGYEITPGWVDVISSVIATNGASEAPTNYPQGAYFTATATLRILYTNTTTFIDSSNATTALIFQPVVGSDFCCLYDGNNPDWRVRRFAGGTWNAGYVSSEQTCFNDPALNVDMDIAVVRTGAASISIFTNGVPTAYMNVAQPYQAMPQFFGSIQSGPNRGFQGYIKEIWYATNAWNSTSLSNFHYYATNTYHYAP